MRHQWDASLNKLWCRNQIRKKRHWNSPQVVPGEPYLPPAVAYPLSMFHLTIFNSSSLTVSVVLPHHHLATLGRARLTPSTNQALFAMLAVRSIIWNNKTFSTSEGLIRGPSAHAISQETNVYSPKTWTERIKKMVVCIAASTSHTFTDKERVCEEGS